MLRIDRSKLKWKAKLAGAFDKTGEVGTELGQHDKRDGKRSKWTLFLLPLITVLREGLEAVVFIGGVRSNLSSSARLKADFWLSSRSRSDSRPDQFLSPPL
jgi:high-affinity iron transporter